MNEEQYQAARKELAELEQADRNDEIDADSAEYVTHRMNCLRTDIFAYQHPDVAYNPFERLCN